MSTIAAQGQLPLFSIPDVRRDCEMRIAAAFRDICYNDSRPEGCIAGNEFLASQCGVSPGHMPALLAHLKEAGLIACEVTHGNCRRIRPLVDLATVMRSGWKALCVAVLARDKFPKEFRTLAKILLSSRPEGKPDLVKLGIEAAKEAIQGAKRRSKSPDSAQKSEGSLKGSLKRFPIKERSEETSTRNTGASLEPKTAPTAPAPAPAPSLGPVAVSLLTQKLGIPLVEATLLAEGVAKDGGTLDQLRHAADIALKAAPRSLGGFIRSAVRASIRGAAYLLPTPAPSHASDQGLRPQRPVVRAPREPKPAHLESAPVAPQSAPQDRWEALDAATQEGLLQKALAELVAGSPGPIAEQLRRRGTSHGTVIARAKKLAQEGAA